jgi:hypothetical protein
MFEGMLKHTGQLNNTGKHVVVVFMQLPEDKEHALVVDTDALPDMYNESLRRVVESNLGQSAKNLADVLARTPSPDGSSQTMLQKFHAASRLMKTPVSNVTMIPRSGVRWPLTDVIAAMDGDNTPQGFDDLDPETKASIAAEINKFNVHASNQEGTTKAGIRGEAVALLEMAKLLEADALYKREQAYRMDPGLKPKAKVSQEISTELPVMESDTQTVNQTKPARKPAAKKAA